ncbi:MAG TPA: beta-L-arabinofuranosidase domain-containing protein [Candidatus Acidoferrales bacterium]|nr:beta-L-arabinofuranosidase domain-containing protein [Candidatus Acidoferrales bacterium]
MSARRWVSLRRDRLTFWIFLLSALAAFSGLSQALQIPVTVRDRSGYGYRQFPATFGVPFPKGALRDAGALALVDAEGKPLAAQFSVASRWREDQSVKWAHCTFFVDLPAGSTREYRIVQSAAASPNGAKLQVADLGAAIEIVTGPLKLRLARDRGGIIEGAWFDPSGNRRFDDATRIVGASGAGFTLRSGGVTFTAGEDAKIEVEEAGPLQAVIRIAGSHWDAARERRALDFVLRLYAYAGQSTVRLSYSIINRQGEKLSDAVSLESLGLSVPLVLSERRYEFGTGEKALAGVLQQREQAYLYQSASDEYELADGQKRKGYGKTRKPLDFGWVDLHDGSRGLWAGIKWFWQLYPKALAAGGDGTLTAYLFPPWAPPQPIYTGVAKTHEIWLYFHGPFDAGAARQTAAAVQKPPIPAVAPRWVMREARAMGRMVESSPDAYRPEFWPLVQNFDRLLEASRERVVQERDREHAFAGARVDAYGMMNFGDAIHVINDGNKSDPAFGVHWDNIYYDFPYALMLHFLRTGRERSMEIALEAAAHLADVDIAHHDPEGALTGGARPSPALDHWRWDENGAWRISPTWNFFKNESLLYGYLLTGNRWFKDAGMLGADFLLRHDGWDLPNNARSVGHGLFGLLAAYEVSGERKYLERAHWVVARTHRFQDGENKRGLRDGYGPIAWMSGIALEGMKQYYEVTGNGDVPAYARRAVDWIYRNPAEWDPQTRQYRRHHTHRIMLATGLGFVYEHTGEKKYWDLAWEVFAGHLKQMRATSRMRDFAQFFRGPQRFLYYLSRDFAAGHKTGETGTALAPAAEGKISR